MMKKNVVILILLLTGCSTLLPTTNQEVAVSPILIEPLETAPAKEILKPIDWPVTMELLVEKILSSSKEIKGSSLLVDTIQNKMNDQQNTQQLGSMLSQLLYSSHQFNLISQNRLNLAKKALKLEANDSLISRNKIIALARYLKTSYILYTELSGDIDQPELMSQLMEVQSGELLWTQLGQIQRE